MEDYREIYTREALEAHAKELFREERSVTRLDGWFLIREMSQDFEDAHPELPRILRKSGALKEVCTRLPLSVGAHNVFAGTQRDAFARSYALINPNFKVSTFNGYCDPTAVFGDIEPNEEFPAERIEALRRRTADTEYVRLLAETYRMAEEDTAEVVYFVEQVTGHLIPDLRPVLKRGVLSLIGEIDRKNADETDPGRRTARLAMREGLEAVLILAGRYADLAGELASKADQPRRSELALLERTLSRVPARGAENLFEAIQSFLLLWQVMCMEQAPNPFAFSVGNADRIFEPYREREGLPRELAAGLFEHLLVFFNVADRSWAISQNLIVGGMDERGQDLTNLTTYALLDAYYEMNLPQPILSVKLHGGTPLQLYRELGRFFFTPGCLTPSLFNDESVFRVLRRRGAAERDLADYSVAGCQEPLIMGKDNGNTTNSWLNLPKILELTLHDGRSLLSGRRLGRSWAEQGAPDAKAVLGDLRNYFYRNVKYFCGRMAKAANRAARAVAALPVPFLSSLMGGIESGIDVRDTDRQGTEYNGSGCLVHGLAVVADSLVAVDRYLRERPGGEDRLLDALAADFEGYEDVREFLVNCPKYGQNLSEPDDEAREVAVRVNEIVHSLRNDLGNPFRADWSSPSTHLLYGYWVGATPDGRRAREMLGYGIDPLYGEATGGLGLRILSAAKLPFEDFDGGYASHLGLDPNYFRGESFEEKGLEFKKKVVDPLFFPGNGRTAPFYVYVNVTTPEILRKVLAEPAKYAPGGVYIMRIHGTFVNFLDLSPEIQQDIIKRLDLGSTTC